MVGVSLDTLAEPLVEFSPFQLPYASTQLAPEVTLMKRLALHAAMLATMSTCALGAVATAGTYPDYPLPTKNGGGALIGDTVYVGLGVTDKFYALNLKEQGATWKEIAAFPGGQRTQPAVAAVAGKLYVFGGHQANAQGVVQIVNDAYVYDPVTNVWTKLETRAPRGLTGASTATYLDRVFIFGGVNEGIFNGYFQDAAANKGNDAKLAEINANYFEKRTQDYFFTPEMYSYDPATNKWRNEGVFPFPARAGAAFAIHDGKAIVVNGEVKPGLRTPATEVGTITAEKTTWKSLGDLPAPQGKTQDGIAGAMGGYTNGYYIVTGGANFIGSVESYKKGNLHAHKGLTKAWHSEVYALDSKGKWKIIGNMPENIGYGVAVTYGNKVVMIGGETDGGKALSKVQVVSYDGKKLVVE